MGTLPQFVTELGEPAKSTSEYWTRYAFLLLMCPKNIQIDELLQNTDPLDAQEGLQMKIAKAIFVTWRQSNQNNANPKTERESTGQRSEMEGAMGRNLEYGQKTISTTDSTLESENRMW